MHRSILRPEQATRALAGSEATPSPSDSHDMKRLARVSTYTIAHLLVGF